jgi:DNA ligase-1
MDFPVLYKKTATGAEQFWHIATQDNSIITAWGQTDGAIQTTTDVISQGKNQGRANETTPIQQAELEAQALWTKKLKKGYCKTREEAATGAVDACIEGGVFPMLAHKYAEKGDKVKWPAYVQPKFDGHRCIGVVKDGKAGLWSRTRKPITGLPHLIAALELLGRDLILDGELYNHDYHARFEELSSFIRNSNPKPGHEVVQYHVYDLVDLDRPFSDRTVELEGLHMQAPLIGVQTLLAADEDEAMLHFDRFLEQGYEGCMVRNGGGKYVNKRSADLLKIKEFDDGEFTVVGVKEGRGKLAGHAIFVCAFGDKTFDAKMKGKTEVLKTYWENPGLALGRSLTVKYQGLTNKAGVPRFPVALRFRDDV